MPFLPFIPFLDGAESIIHFTQQSSQWILTQGWKFSGPVTLTDLQNLASALDAWITAQLAAEISNSVSIDYIKVTGLTTVTDPTVTIVPTTPAGTLTGLVLAAQTALVVTFLTANRGRSFRGRNYVAGRVNGDLLTVTTWQPARVAAMGLTYVNQPGIVNPTGWTHQILSRFNNGVRRTVGVSTPVLQYVAKGQVATQRKRLV